MMYSDSNSSDEEIFALTALLENGDTSLIMVLII